MRHDPEVHRLRERATRRRIVAQTLTSSEDIEIALHEAFLADAEADRLEAALAGRLSSLTLMARAG